MLLKPDCIPCILKMSLNLLRELSLDDESFQRLYRRILDLPALRGRDWQTTSPDVIETIMGLAERASGCSDPLASAKARMNEQAESLYPFLEKVVRRSSDPLHTAVKIAILGNAIDIMMADQLSGVEALIKEKLEAPLSKADYGRLAAKISGAKKVVYFCDNAGEIVFDRLLFETLLDGHPGLKITAVVRSRPTLNDATLDEAESVGLHRRVRVIANGTEGPLPGTQPARCAPRVQALLTTADLIISKGGGNFDTLGEVCSSLPTDVAFMLLAKCKPYTDYFGAQMHQPLLWYHRSEKNRQS